ncbi:MAG: glycosyltransferase, partial [Candidatus Omnitrophica bacterium]|nr:glycosyltransferase [Candidatus Omnitrophota bacterium]
HHEIGPVLLGRNATDQSAIDRLLIELDATPNKARLGANALLAVSLATAYAAAEAQGISIIEHLSRLWQECTGTSTPPCIPLPMVNMISGGCHAGRQLEFQDVLVIPIGAQSYSQALEWIVAVYHRLGEKAVLFLTHEPIASFFSRDGIPLVVFSHGIERRGWQITNTTVLKNTIRLRSRVLLSFIRLRRCDKGIRVADKLLLSNQDDKRFVENYYHRHNGIFVFKNGVFDTFLTEHIQPQAKDKVILFSGTWTKRKGTMVLIKAAEILFKKGLRLKWVLAGTRLPVEKVMEDWPHCLHTSIEVIPYYNFQEEEKVLEKANVFVLPSFFEGQPLVLLQALRAGRCCVASDCCGQKDIIRHGENGLLFPPGDSEKLAVLLEECVKNEGLRLRLGKHARLSMSNRSWEVVSAEIVREVGSLVK